MSTNSSRAGLRMILTVTANAAVDKTLTVANLQLGRRHRAQQGLVMPGGKGINVARALRRLDEPVIATGLAGGRAGMQITDGLDSEGILNDFVRIGGESRTSTAVVDPTSGLQTEINEYGPEVTADEVGGAGRPRPLPGRRGLDGRVRGQPAAQDRDLVLRRRDARDEPAQGQHRDRHRRRAAAAGPGGRADAGVPQPARGGGAGRQRVPDRRGLPARALGDRGDGRARRA